jgi:hypothetical protein
LGRHRVGRVPQWVAALAAECSIIRIGSTALAAEHIMRGVLELLKSSRMNYPDSTHQEACGCQDYTEKKGKASSLIEKE